MLRIKTLMAAALVVAGALATLAGCTDSPLIESTSGLFSPEVGTLLPFTVDNPAMVCLSSLFGSDAQPARLSLHFVPFGKTTNHYVLVQDDWKIFQPELIPYPLEFYPVPGADSVYIGTLNPADGTQDMYVAEADATSFVVYTIDKKQVEDIIAAHHIKYDKEVMDSGTPDEQRQAIYDIARTRLTKAQVVVDCRLDSVNSLNQKPPTPAAPDTAAPTPAPDTATPAPTTPAPDTAAPAPDSSKKN